MSSEEINEIVVTISTALKSEFDSYRNTMNARIAALEKANATSIENLYQDVKKLTAAIENRPKDANPAMDRQEFPEGMREWEVLEFKASYPNEQFDMHLSLNKNGYCNVKGARSDGLNLEYMLSGEKSVSSGHYTIHSISRLSDGSVWTLGDTFAIQDHSTIGKIQMFELKGNDMLVCADLYSTPLANIFKPTPVFTTNDGVAVYEGDTVWFTSRGKKVEERRANKELIADMHYSTQEVAYTAYLEYIDAKQVLSIEEVNKYNLSELRDIVKARLKATS